VTKGQDRFARGVIYAFPDAIRPSTKRIVLFFSFRKSAFALEAKAAPLECREAIHRAEAHLEEPIVEVRLERLYIKQTTPRYTAL
jgi:hypothetical protein